MGPLLRKLDDKLTKLTDPDDLDQLLMQTHVPCTPNKRYYYCELKQLPKGSVVCA